MPQKKRPLAEADANAQPEQPNSKRSKAEEETENDRSTSHAAEESEPDSPDNDPGKRPPYEYICMSKPPYAGVYTYDDDYDEDEDERDEEEIAAEEAEPDDGSDPHRVRTKTMWNRLASDYPAWPYTIMADTWCRLCDVVRLESYTDPEAHGMWVYSDFHAHGVVEIIENLLIEFNKSHGTSNKKPDVDKMWCTCAVIAHFLNRTDGPDMWLCIDDGPRCEKTLEVLGTALLTTLDHISRAAELKQGSKYLDLGLVMALWLKLSVQPAEIPMEDGGVYWRTHLIAYAKKAGIDLCKQQIAGIEKTVESLQASASEKELDHSGDVWKWNSRFKELAPRGGDRHNIMLWTHKERAQAAFDKKDPLAKFSTKDLREGNIMLA